MINKIQGMNSIAYGKALAIQNLVEDTFFKNFLDSCHRCKKIPDMVVMLDGTPFATKV